MDALELEINTKPASNFIEIFFSKLPIDSRFNKVEFQRFVPVTGLSKNTTKIDFKLEKRDPPQCYLISKAIIEVSVSITTSDSTSLPASTKKVASINNSLHSLFSSVSMQINDQNVTNSQEDYPYKTYVANLLTFSADSKSSVLETQGWATDTKRSMETTSNTGFLLRNQFWRKDMASAQDYRPQGCTFLGKLYHDLASCDKPLPPNTRVYFELKRSSDSFYIMTTDDDTEKYKAIITSCNLYVPIAWMQMEMLRELQVRLPKETVKYHFRRWTVRQMGIPRNKSDFYSDSLFSESENPVRIFFMIVDSAAYNGDIHKNPFNFARKWTVTTAERGMNLSEELETNQIQGQLRQMQEMINVLVNRSQPSAPPQPEPGPSAADKGKGPQTRKSSVQTEKEPQERKSSLQTEKISLFEKLANLLGRGPAQVEDEEADFEIVRDSHTEELLRQLREKLEPPTPQLALAPIRAEVAATKTFWLTKCQLELNSQLPGNKTSNFFNVTTIYKIAGAGWLSGLLQ